MRFGGGAVKGQEDVWGSGGMGGGETKQVGPPQVRTKEFWGGEDPVGGAQRRRSPDEEAGTRRLGPLAFRGGSN